MNQTGKIENISDTALWVAAYRAMETERPGSKLQDPLAKVLAGEQGMKIAREMSELSGGKHSSFPIIVRTCVLDEMILKVIRDHRVRTVVNLAAGLDTRPYRLDLPPDLRWVEIDLPGILDYKESKLAGEKPRCRLQRIRTDLSDAHARRAAFRQLALSAGEALVLTEGFVIYLKPEQVAALAKDLHDHIGFGWWMLEYCSPRLLKMLQGWYGAKLQAANSPMQFAVADGTSYFAQFGWKMVEERFGSNEAIRLDLVMPIPWYYRVMGLFMSKAMKEEYRRLHSFALLQRA